MLRGTFSLRQPRDGKINRDWDISAGGIVTPGISVWILVSVVSPTDPKGHHRSSVNAALPTEPNQSCQMSQSPLLVHLGMNAQLSAGEKLNGQVTVAERRVECGHHEIPADMGAIAKGSATGLYATPRSPGHCGL